MENVEHKKDDRDFRNLVPVQNKVRLWYQRKIASNSIETEFSGVTVAVIWDGNDRYMGVSECSDNDQFSRKKGRTIAIGRAQHIRNPRGRKVDSRFMKKFTVDAPPEDVTDVIPEHMYKDTPREQNSN